MYRILIFSNQQRYRLSLSKEYAISRYSLNSMYLITASVDHKWGGAYSLRPKTAQKTPCKRVRSHFQQSLDITRSQTVHAEMNITRQKVGLSFSIENILQDDFCHSRRRDVPLCISARKILSLVPTILYNPFRIELKSRQNYNDVRNDSE